MDRMLAPVIEAIWGKVVESFSSRVVEHTVDNALNSVNNVRDFELIFENLQKNLKSLSAKAADVDEDIMNRELSRRKKRKREVKEWLEEVESIKQVVVELGSQIESEGFVTRFTDGGKAAQLDEQVKELVEQSHNFGELVLDVCGTSGDTFLTDGMVGEAFNENMETILRLLESREVSSIGVYGMGGVGKTTLVKHVNNRLLQQQEGCVFWVTVSQEFTVTGLQDKIAHLLGLDLSDEDEVGKRAMRLHTTLSQQKNSVLILDDVWENINMLEVGCSVSTERCRLIITTRSLGVSRGIGCQKEIPVGKLDESEAWKLFTKRLGNEKELDPEIEGIAKSMVNLCGGLPLGIITVAGSMRGKRVTHRWRNAFLELQERVKGKDGMCEDEVFKVLKFSFDRLKKKNDKSNEFNTEQLCFLYCSLYPQDYKIGREGLVRNFISEGLLSERKSRRARIDQGHSILDELVEVCLLESCVDHDGKGVKMHDLVRSMALKICEGKYMVRAEEWSLEEIPNEEEWTKDLEKVSFMKCGISRIGEGISPDCPKLSTLLLSGNSLLDVIPESFFSKLRGLCTLDLCYTDIKTLPTFVSDLQSLKTLLLENCRELEYVPYLGKLKALRELDLSGTAIEEVPQGLEESHNLRFFSIDAVKLKLFPKGLLPKLGHLQHLNLPFHLQVEIEELENLKLLEEFNGGVGCVEDFNCFIRSGESRRERNTWYTIVVGEKHVFENFEAEEPFSEIFESEEPFDLEERFFEVFEEKEHSFGSSSYKKKLGLFGCKMEDERVLGQKTEFLIISECKNLSISFLDDFSGLKELNIKRCGGIEWILRSDSPISNTLEKIRLVGLDDLKGLVMQIRDIGASTAPMQPYVFSSLTRLSIYKCRKMRKMGLAISGLPNLEEISINLCGEIEEIFEEDERRSASIVTTLPKLQNLNLWKLRKLKKVGLPVSRVPNLKFLSIDQCREIKEIFQEEVGGNPVTSLPRLILLKLEDLPRVESISKATIISNSIIGINIKECPRLINKLPLHMDVVPPPSLKEIKVEREWWESLEWDTNINPNLPQLLLPFVQFQDSCSFDF